MKRRIFGQGVLDYVFLITIVIVTLLIMGYYIRNKVSGKWHSAGDAIGGGRIYEPRSTGETTVERTVVNQ